MNGLELNTSFCCTLVKVLFNFSENNQQDAQIGYFGTNETIKEMKDLYEKVITQQKEEIIFLRSLLKDKN